MRANQSNSKYLSNDSEIQFLQAKVASLSSENNNLSSELSKLKLLCNSLIGKEANYASIQSQLNEKEAKISKLKEEAFELSRSSINSQHKLKLQYEKDVTQVKYQQENFAVKIETASQIERLNEAFYKKILELEIIILHFKEEEQKRIDSIELKHQTKSTALKKKMLTFLKNEAHNKASPPQQIMLNTKLNSLHKSEMINELEFQSCLIESLLKERDDLALKVKELHNDIKIHREVENCLGEKNKLFEQQLKSIIQLDKPSETSLAFNKTISKRHYPQSSFNTINTELNSRNHLKLSENCRLHQSLKAKDKQIENWEAKYHTAQSKLDSIERRYSAIGLLCSEALEEVYSNGELEIDKIYLSLSQFKQCDFEMMSRKQRYAALVIIIKYILPLVNKEVFENNALLSKVDLIRTKVYAERSQVSSQRVHTDSDYTFSSATANTDNKTSKRTKNIRQIQITPSANLTQKTRKPLLQVKNKLDLGSFSLLKVDYE